MEIRRVKADELEQAINLADHTFRQEGHVSMGEAFPQVFSKELGFSYGAFEGEKLVSFIGLVPSEIRINEAKLHVFSIGAVCTDEAYRNRGISSAILKEVYEYIDQAGASLLFVSGDRGLYKRNDCYYFGKTNNYKLSKQNIVKNEYSASVRLGCPSDIFQIDEIRHKNNVRYESNIWEWAMLLKASGYTSILKMKQSLYIAEQNGKIEGYVVIGLPNEKSTTNQAKVTEWGGNPKAVHGIFAELMERNTMGEIAVSVPWHDALNDELSNYQLEVKQNGGTVYIVDVERFIKQVKPYLISKNAEVAQNTTIQAKEDGNIRIQYKELKTTVTMEELVKRLFDFQSDSKIGELQEIFPIPLPNTVGMHYV